MNGQSAPIQEGTTSFDGRLFHNGDLGLGIQSPTARLHLYDSGATPPFGSYFSDDFIKVQRDIITWPPLSFTTETYFTVKSNGNVGINTDNPTEILHVKNGNLLVESGNLIIRNPNGLGAGDNQIALNTDGTIRAREIKVDLQTIPDYVFAEGYELMPLEELAEFVEENKHLPRVKSEADFEEEGSISLTEMNLKLLEKVEELTLYILDLQTQIDNLKK